MATPSPLLALLSLPPPLDLPLPSLTLLLSPFSPASPLATSRPLSLAILSRPLSPATTSLLLSTLTSFLSASATSSSRIQGLSAFTAILQVAPATALSFLQDPKFQGGFSQSVESISRGRKDGEDCEGEGAALVQLLVEAAGVSSLRNQIRETAGAWLDSLLDNGKKDSSEEKELVRAMAGVAIIKLRLGREEGMPAPPQRPSEPTLSSLGELLSSIYINSSCSTTETSFKTSLVALEGLSYLTLPSTPSSSALKSTLITSTSPFLSALLPKIPRELTPPYAYTLSTLLSHLTAFPAPTPATAPPSALSPGPIEPPETSSSVTTRNSLLLYHPLLPTLHALSTSPQSSSQTRSLVCKTYLSLISDKTLRPNMIAKGVAKDLRKMLVENGASIRLEREGRRCAVQGVARLLITAQPDLVFDEGGLLDMGLLMAVEVAELDEVDEKSESGAGGGKLLRIFECLMALTNIVSLGGEVAEKIAAVVIGREEKGKGKAGRGMLRIVESAMLSSNSMVQRAATELACNLVCTDAGLYYYEPKPSGTISSPAPPADSTSTSTLTSIIAPKSKGLSPSLHILLALCSSPDLSSQLAASGALAVLISSSPLITFAIFTAQPPKGWEALLELVREGGDEGLAMRGWDWVISLTGWLKAEKVEEEEKEEARLCIKEWEGRLQQIRNSGGVETVEELLKGLKVE